MTSHRPKVGDCYYDIHGDSEELVHTVTSNSDVLAIYDHAYKTAMTCSSLAYFTEMSYRERRAIYPRVFEEAGIIAWLLAEQDMFMDIWWRGFEDGAADRLIWKSEPSIINLPTGS